jgi:DnaA-homolog protein
MHQQLTLPVSLRDDATFSNYVAGDNRHIVSALHDLINNNTDERFVYLWGAPGVGCTHLQQACCHTIFERRAPAMYLSLADKALRPDVLCNLEVMDFMFIDDLQAVLGHRLWEESLLHFYNRLRDGGCRLVVAANAPPVQLACTLPDLVSRLSWGLVFPVKIMSDTSKKKAIQLRATSRGFKLSDEVAHYVLKRYPRDMTALFQVLDVLDQASLIAKRKITVPFVKEALSSAGR